ncbi:MAG: hypothetical protein GXP26_14020 [Planctomycetes bacterium]|nr:hypothetical protein [Planctomycetota bacterium]
MDRKLVGAILLVLASGGCRACTSSCDHLPPVLDGPYPTSGVRAGSAFGGTIVPAYNEADEITSLEGIPNPKPEGS